MEKLNLTPNMKLLFDNINPNLLANIINNKHVSFNVVCYKTLKTLNILIDVENHKDQNITNIVNKLNKNYHLTGCVFTPSYERTDQVKNTYYLS
jgi:hypothetical protein